MYLFNTFLYSHTSQSAIYQFRNIQGTHYHTLEYFRNTVVHVFCYVNHVLHLSWMLLFTLNHVTISARSLGGAVTSSCLWFYQIKHWCRKRMHWKVFLPTFYQNRWHWRSSPTTCGTISIFDSFLVYGVLWYLW